MSDFDLAWRVDEACMNGLPALRHVLIGGWLARLSGGRIRRTNSVSPLRWGGHDPTPVLAAFEQLYAANSQSVIYRVPSIALGMDRVLAATGHEAFAESLTLFADLSNWRSLDDADLTFAAAPTEDWLGVRAKANGDEPAALELFRRMTALIAQSAIFVTCRFEGQVVGIAYGVMHDTLMVIEAVATTPEARNRGLARRTVSGLISWGRRQGAESVCLQVSAGNAPALKVYKRLGFDRELYRYHYRRKP